MAALRPPDAHPASFRFLHSAVPALAGDDGDSQVPGRPSARVPRSRTPTRSPRSLSCSGVTPTLPAAMLPSTLWTVSALATSPFRGSIARPACSLSTLRSRNCSRSTQDSLPAGSSPLPGGTDSFPQGRYLRFPCFSTSLPPHPGLSWRNQIGGYAASGGRGTRDPRHSLCTRDPTPCEPSAQLGPPGCTSACTSGRAACLLWGAARRSRISDFKERAPRSWSHQRARWASHDRPVSARMEPGFRG